MARTLTPAEIDQLIGRAKEKASPPPVTSGLIGGNEGQRRVNSGLIGDLMDYLSRPARASAGVAYALTDKDPSTGVLGGLLGGLEGKTAHSYSDVLSNLGVRNKYVRALGGFGLDVALDPLTYLGIEHVPGMSDAESSVRGLKSLVESGASDFGDIAVKAAADQIQATNPTHWYVKFGRKQVTPDFGSYTQPIVNTIKKAIAGPEESRNLLARALSRESELPYGLAEKSRVYELQNTNAWQDMHEAITKSFQGLTDEEKKRVTLALEGDVTGTIPLHGVPVANPNGPHLEVGGQKFTNLGQYQDLARNLFKQMFDDEVQLGLYKPEQFRDNYVYKYYKNKDWLPTAVGPRRSMAKTISEFTLNEIAEDPQLLKNMDPVFNIDEILQLRANKHFRTVGRQAFIEDALDKFGIKVEDKSTAAYKAVKKIDGQSVVDHLDVPVVQKNLEKYQDVYLPKPILNAIKRSEEVFRIPSIGAEALRHYDKALSVWKRLNLFSPGNMARNSMSDALLNFFDGVHNPQVYEQAGRVLSWRRGRTAEELLGADALDNIEGIQQLAQEGANAFGNAAQKRSVRIGGKEYSYDQIWDAYTKSGSKSGYISNLVDVSPTAIADEGQQASALINALQANSQRAAAGVGDGYRTVMQKWQDANNTREDFFRMGHFIHSLGDELPKYGGDLEQAAMAAGKRVRKYNIDYGSLSTFEKNVASRVIPFYGWMRKNTPLQIEMMLTKPGLMAMYPKGQDLMQGILGTEDGTGDYMIPKWIRDSAPVRIAIGNNEQNKGVLNRWIQRLTGANSNESVFLPIVSSMTPLGDLQNVTEPIQTTLENIPNKGIFGGIGAGVRAGISKTFVNQATPLLKMPVEAATGKSLYTGSNIEDQPHGWAGWLLDQLGPTRIGSNLVGGIEKPQQILSFATGLQAQPITANRQAGEFRRREDVLQAVKAQEVAQKLASRGINYNEASDRLKRKTRTADTKAIDRWLKANRRAIDRMTA